ncbi:MAG TPA: nicotinamide-nucleotide amidohydrolase family protein [Persephonella sp.]|uniref:CinA-like protein n=1 Tax=Persephonella marina (strain DSM 14350 / EX-H1) TaxID=123214 RepID=C0QT80_PERMH|nr:MULTISPECIES: CinA family nicotinamide mononucleotide deamidase-related protein [Persephonella]ACO04348.1 putative competence-damage inducible protein [Persephonella marina EX-H1]HCB70486.1 nicotinamide-nucleotide amidohydrolase family protein [Persephonella sp.]
MKVFILITGSEFVNGLKLEKNSLFIAREAFERGLEVNGIGIVGDDMYQIQYFIKMALDKSDILIVSGGLGGTQDDLTREAIQEAIGVHLIYDREWLESIKKTLKDQGRALTDEIKKMARLPYGSKRIENPVGKAVGFVKILDDVNKAVVAVPGVPSEMKPMVKKAFEMLGFKEKLKRSHIFRTFGIQELEIDEMLKDIDGVILNSSPKGVDIFVTDREAFFLKNKVDVIRERVGDYVYTEEDIEMEEVVGRLLKEKGLTVSTAESSTGGLIVSRLVNIPGSSSYVMAGIVSYSNEAKINILGVSKESIKKFGAVSDQVAREMAEGVRRLTGTDISVSDTGIAGPTGATEDKPLGLHYIGYCDGEKTEVHRIVYKGERNDVRLYVSQYALNLIRINIGR